MMSAQPEQSTPTVLITDLDNTLWDWFEAWYRSFSTMLNTVSELSGVPVSTLESEMRAVHQRYGTSEYSFLLNEVPSLVKAARGERPSVLYDRALHALNAARKQNTRLYPGVAATLAMLRGHGVKIVAFTESTAFWTEWRIKETGLDGVIDILYSNPDHDWPDRIDPESFRRRSAEAYGLKKTVHRHVAAGSTKPNPAVLTGILDDLNVTPREAIYVGDSLMKDMAMAQVVGVPDAYALYGVVIDRPEYDLLRRVSHWTDDDVQREKALAARPAVIPTHVLPKGLEDVLPLFGIKEAVHVH